MTLSEQLRRWWCGLGGHDAVLHFGERRMELRCHCGYVSEGWEISGTPRRRFDGDAQKHRLRVMRMVIGKKA